MSMSEAICGSVKGRHGVVGRVCADTRAPITLRELVEWTYAVQHAHRGGSARVGPAGISQTGLVIERLQLGCSIDKSSSGSQFWGQTHCDDDALAVHGAVEGMSAAERLTLIRHGEARATPEWQPLIMPLRVLSVPGRKGKPRGIYAGSGRRLIGHEITYEGDILTREEAISMRWHWPEAPHLRCAEEVIAFAREQYAAWYEALERLAEKLAASSTPLRRWRIAGLGADGEPWVNAGFD